MKLFKAIERRSGSASQPMRVGWTIMPPPPLPPPSSSYSFNHEQLTDPIAAHSIGRRCRSQVVLPQRTSMFRVAANPTEIKAAVLNDIRKKRSQTKNTAASPVFYKLCFIFSISFDLFYTEALCGKDFVKTISDSQKQIVSGDFRDKPDVDELVLSQ
ncbi:unnamed protein product [Angiostrongylus costaricensis]|uniref:Uncharacterized protein n=1 Tax=Angiostrongylus costaricensis TaxID=334426 RepID=A0A158PMP1_ANGCS|nr:unnamed protein product [Angiostrongylus costaricensis]